MLSENQQSINAGIAAWQELDHGTAMVCGFAELCRRALISPPEQPVTLDQLSEKSLAILACGRVRGVVDVRGSRDEFDAVDRFLAVCVESEPDRRFLFRRKEDPRQTVEYLEAFAQLCRNGLVLHHLSRDFSFSATGFALANSLSAEQLTSLAEVIEFGVEIEH